MDLWKCSATELARLIAAREASAVEVLDSVLERTAATNPDLNAITYSLEDEGREAAIAADQALIKGAEIGPLHGVPMTIKENVDQAGHPTPNGIPALAKLTATANAPLVSNMLDAGVVIFGRTNTPEFSMRGTTDNPLRGRTFNPWHEDASPGGSSGGAGSACAAGMGPLHHGNDIGGSLRFPSYANGVVTVKPSSFRVPAFNSTWTADRPLLSTTMSCQGVIARHAADVRVATQAMIAPSPLDPYHVPLPWDGPETSKKIGLTTESGGYPIHPELVAMIHTAADHLRDAGYVVEEVETPSMKAAAAEWFRAGSTEMNLSLQPAIEQFGSQDIQNIFGWYFELSELLDLDGYVNAMGSRGTVLREWSLFLDEYPLLLTPFLMRPMYDWDYDARGLSEVEDLFSSAIYSTGVNYLGLPAGVISMDFVEERPAAIQIVGQRYREDLIVDALEAIEDRNGVMAHRLWDRES